MKSPTLITRPEIISRYLPIVIDINSHITSFNNFLNEDFKIPLFDLYQFDDDLYFHILNGKKWEEISFPRKCDVGGVYFYFGYSTQDISKLLIYVGKASLTMDTGRRLWAHFKHSFDDNGQIHKIHNGEKYYVEAVLLIPFDRIGTICLSPALEEYIICELAKEKKYDLYNVRGK